MRKQEFPCDHLLKWLTAPPTYISKIERDELAPPAEDVIKDIARILKQDEDSMITLAGRVPSDLPEIIKSHPKEMALMLRSAKRLTPSQLQEINQSIASMTKKK